MFAIIFTIHFIVGACYLFAACQDPDIRGKAALSLGLMGYILIIFSLVFTVRAVILCT